MHPTQHPSLQPSQHPSIRPSQHPSIHPTQFPTLYPSQHPSLKPSQHPSIEPTLTPSIEPTRSFGYTKLVAPDSAAGDRFGYSVCISGGTIVVGSPFDSINGVESGSAHIFDTSGNHVKRITPPDGSTNDKFGRSISISGSRMVIGAEGDSTNGISSGSAHIFDTSGNYIRKLLPNDGAASDQFGDAVAISGTAVVVGSPMDDDQGDRSGSAYIFDLSGNLIEKVVAFDGGAGHYFGFSVDVCEERLIIGAYADDENGFRSGAAYLYNVDGSFEKKIVAFDGASDDEFGYSVAISNTTIVIGSPLDDDHGSRSGSAYFYNEVGEFRTKVTAPDSNPSEFFGWSVTISDDSVLIGAPNDLVDGLYSGAAFLFNIYGRYETMLTWPEALEADQFGYSLSMSEGIIMLGAPFNHEDGQGSLAGAALLAI